MILIHLGIKRGTTTGHGTRTVPPLFHNYVVEGGQFDPCPVKIKLKNMIPFCQIPLMLFLVTKIQSCIQGGISDFNRLNLIY